MARIKYSDEFNPLRKKHFGFTFIANHYGQSLLPAQRNSRARYSNQFQRMQNLQKCVRFWRTMAPETKTAWDNFASAFPQPSKRDPLIPLTGYQLFLKRNHYCFLNFDIETDFITLPEMVSLPVDSPVFNLTAGINTIDLTDLYIKNFGVLPSPGQWLNFMAVPYSETSGQFFNAVYSVLEVLNTYIDGFFLNVETPGNVAGLTYSVYLSKPLNKGSYIKSSKVRYMGCFTTKSFLGLSDTPDSYAGQAGKIVKVKADESGLEFGENSGGGLTCEDLPECETIEDIVSDISDITLSVVLNLGISIPNVNFGLGYNHFVVTAANNIAPAGWHVPTRAEWNALATYLGGLAVAGGKLKETGLVHWQTPNTGADNSTKAYLKGCGSRSSTSGAFLTFKQTGVFWCYDKQSANTAYSFKANYNAAALVDSTTVTKGGGSIILFKDSTTKVNGQFGYMVGNTGRVYRTICIGTVEITADPLAETNFRDGTAIPEITDGATWAATSTPALYAINNDWNNV